jgi:uncharacterized coiled-coil protein SlyX
MANNSTGVTKLFGGVVALVAIIAGVYAMVEPMHQQIAFQNERINDLVAAAREDTIRERVTQGQMSTIMERFKEIETQFRAVDARVKKHEEWLVWWERTVPGCDATQKEKIAQLERVVFGEPAKE